MRGSMRTITVVLEIQDAEEAREIWQKHLNRELLSGCYVTKIVEGDLQAIIKNHQAEIDESYRKAKNQYRDWD